MLAEFEAEVRYFCREIYIRICLHSLHGIYHECLTLTKSHTMKWFIEVFVNEIAGEGQITGCVVGKGFIIEQNQNRRDEALQVAGAIAG